MHPDPGPRPRHVGVDKKGAHVPAPGRRVREEDRGPGRCGDGEPWRALACHMRREVCMCAGMLHPGLEGAGTDEGRGGESQDPLLEERGIARQEEQMRRARRPGRWISTEIAMGGACSCGGGMPRWSKATEACDPRKRPSKHATKSELKHLREGAEDAEDKNILSGILGYGLVGQADCD